jgi:hypothetical protein
LIKKGAENMKKHILLLVIFILCISVVTSWAEEECFITWQGDLRWYGYSSGQISTNETSRTAQAAEELYYFIYNGSDSWLDSDCYGHELFLEGEYPYYFYKSVCLDGTWQWVSWDITCGSNACDGESGTWDVVCGPDTDVDNDGIPDFLDSDTIYGTISGDVQEDITVNIYISSCGAVQPHTTITTDAQGYYAIGDLANGRYLVGPEDAGYSFSSSYWVDIPQTEIQPYDFTAINLCYAPYIDCMGDALEDFEYCMWNIDNFNCIFDRIDDESVCESDYESCIL